MPKLVVNREYLLQKYPGKGGWTYVAIEEIKPDKRQKFGWVQVCGTIDEFEIKQYKLMPMGDGRLFLPVRAEIRKKIKKEAGDFVKITLSIDHSIFDTPQEFLICLEDDQQAKKFYQSLSDSEKKFYIDWIYSAKKEETKIERLAQTINRLNKGLKRYA